MSLSAFARPSAEISPASQLATLPLHVPSLRFARSPFQRAHVPSAVERSPVTVPPVPALPPVGVPALPPVGVPAAPPVGVPAAPPVGVPAAPPVGVPAAPPVGVPALPPLGEPALPP